MSKQEHNFNGLFHIVEAREGVHYGHGLISSPPAIFPDAETREIGLQLAIQKAKRIDGGKGVTIIQEYGYNVLPPY
jgi:hypothetical protein